MGLLDARHLVTKAKFTSIYTKAASLGCTGFAITPIQQEIDFDNAHTTLQSNSQSYTNTFIQKTGLNSAGFSLVDGSIMAGTGIDMTTILADTCSIMKNITDGNIYDAIDSTLDLMLLPSTNTCTALTDLLPVLDTNNQGILTTLDIYAVADELETSIQNFVSQYGFATNIFTAGPAFYDTMKCCLDQVTVIDANFGLIKNTLNNAFQSLINGTDAFSIMQTIKNDVASMLNLPNTLSSLYSRITGNSLHGPRTC